MYFRLSNTKFVVLTVAHASETNELDHEGQEIVDMAFQEACFFSKRDGIKKYKAKFTCKLSDFVDGKKESRVAIPEEYFSNPNTESGLDIGLLVVDLVDDANGQAAKEDL